MPIAYIDRGDSRFCTTSDGKTRLAVADAETLGYLIANEQRLAPDTVRSTAAKSPLATGASAFDRAYSLAVHTPSYLAQIMAMPEAAARPQAARMLAAQFNAETMPLANAASFLRGLPLETAAEGNAPASARVGASTPTRPDMAKFDRLASIRVAGLRTSGGAANNKEASRIEIAMRTYHACGGSLNLGECFSRVGFKDARAAVALILNAGRSH